MTDRMTPTHEAHADLTAREEAADAELAREAEAVLAEGGPTISMAELLADLFTEPGTDSPGGPETEAARRV